MNWKRYLLNPWFLSIAAVKVVVGAVLASDYMVNGFIPFVNYYVTSAGSNPYDFFLQLGHPEAFPYPPLMLWILSMARVLIVPFVSADWMQVTFVHLAAMRLPIFLADVAIYLVLCAWLEAKEKYVLWLYWASPILFFINYVHGQLDVIPMALLFGALALLFNKRALPAAVLLGLAVATKTHLLVVLPFFFIYWKVNRYGWKLTALYTTISILIFGCLLLPLIQSTGFISSVFGTEEAYKLYSVHLTYFTYTQPPIQLALFLAPLCMVVLFLNFFAYRKLNKDAFLLILALVFSVFLVLVPPMPGWFYWSIPFIVYFFAKYREIPQASFWLMNLAFITYSVVSVDSTLISSLQVIAPHIDAQTANVFSQLAAVGVNAELLANLVFTTLVGSIAVNVWWVYRIGVRSNLEYDVVDKPLVIGVGGDSGAGKNALVTVLQQLFGAQQTTVVEGDDAHKWERNDAHWKEHTHLDPKSNNLHQELAQAMSLKTGKNVQRSLYDHATGSFTDASTVHARQTILYVGLHPFYLSKMRQQFDIKVYIEPDEQLRRFWKIERDTKQRGRSMEDVLRQMEQREPDAKKYIHPQRQFADIVVNFAPAAELIPGQKPKVFLRLLCDNSIPLDPFLQALAEHPTLAVEHSYEEDLKHQTITFSGLITADEIRTLAYTLIPNVDELVGTQPQWLNDYDGLTQLFVAYYHHHARSSK